MKLSMKSIYLIALLLIVMAGCVEGDAMKLTSTAFEEGAEIPSKYTCDGEDMLVPLTISDVPENAKSLALVMDDPDAPMGTWDHWLLWNMAPNTKEITALPKAVYGSNSWKRTAWGGPCPPDKEHRYYWKLYAVDTELDLPEGSTKAELEKAMEGHIIEQAVLKGRYDRKR